MPGHFFISLSSPNCLFVGYGKFWFLEYDLTSGIGIEGYRDALYPPKKLVVQSIICKPPPPTSSKLKTKMEKYWIIWWKGVLREFRVEIEKLFENIHNFFAIHYFNFQGKKPFSLLLVDFDFRIFVQTPSPQTQKNLEWRWFLHIPYVSG